MLTGRASGLTCSEVWWGDQEEDSTDHTDTSTHPWMQNWPRHQTRLPCDKKKWKGDSEAHTADMFCQVLWTGSRSQSILTVRSYTLKFQWVHNTENVTVVKQCGCVSFKSKCVISCERGLLLPSICCNPEKTWKSNPASPSFHIFNLSSVTTVFAHLILTFMVKPDI